MVEITILDREHSIEQMLTSNGSIALQARRANARHCFGRYVFALRYRE
jgi:hypothetical protein